MADARGAVDEQTRAAVAKLMRRSKVQASGVARAALTAVVDNELYCVPMRDGAMLWRLKRALPSRFYALVARVDPKTILRRVR